MVCEVTAGTLLYGTIPLLAACATTAMVPTFYRVNWPHQHKSGNSVRRELESSARRCPCLAVKRGIPDSCTSAVIRCRQGIQFKGSQFPNRVTGISGDLRFTLGSTLHGDALAE